MAILTESTSCSMWQSMNRCKDTYGLGEKKIVIFWLDAEVFED